MYQTQKTRMAQKAILQAIQRQLLTLVTGRRKVTDTSNRILQQKFLSNWTLPIVTTTMNPRIDDRISTCGGTAHALATPTTKEVITDTTHSSARVSRTPWHISRIGRDSTTPGDFEISLRYLQANSPVLIGGITLSPSIGHSRCLQVFNKRKPTISENIGDTQK